MTQINAMSWREYVTRGDVTDLIGDVLEEDREGEGSVIQLIQTAVDQCLVLKQCHQA